MKTKRMAERDGDADVKVREVLRIAKDLYAAQQQTQRLLTQYKNLLGKLPGELWTSTGCLTVVDADRAVWRLVWNGGYPSVERVAAVDVLDEPTTEPNAVLDVNEAADGDAPAMWKEARDL